MDPFFGSMANLTIQTQKGDPEGQSVGPFIKNQQIPTVTGFWQPPKVYCIYIYIKCMN